jgi:3'(2'), 5'-bisphosphate nucleotidase
MGADGAPAPTRARVPVDRGSCDTPPARALPRQWIRPVSQNDRAHSPQAQILADLTLLLDDLTLLVARAADAVLAIAPAALDTRLKSDRSPVTAADEASDAVIADGLARLMPGISVVSEERIGRAAPPSLGDRFVLVDPLDGTKELLAGRDEFTINLAVVAGGRPSLGIVAAPALGLLWRGLVGRGATRMRLPIGGRPLEGRPIATRPRPPQGLIATVSRTHLDPATEAFLRRLPIMARTACGSALKLCRVAEGAADVYPRLSPTCEWDICAGHAVLAAAGGTVVNPAGESLRYGNAAGGFRIPAFVAWGDPNAAIAPSA